MLSENKVNSYLSEYSADHHAQMKVTGDYKKSVQFIVIGRKKPKFYSKKEYLIGKNEVGRK